MKATSPNYDPSCMDDFDPGSIDAEQALQQILISVEALSESEIVPIREALGRAVTKEVSSMVNVPGHTNSAMDGFAIRGAEIPTNGQQAFSVIGTSWAGRPYLGSVNKGECIRIMTGAAMPKNTDTVIMQERVQ